MLTPAFELSQDRDFLTVAIRVPHARVSEFDVYFEGVDFKFYAKPYFLRRVPAAGALRLFRSPRSRLNPRPADALAALSLLPRPAASPWRAIGRSACGGIACFRTCGSRHRARGRPPSVCPVTLDPP